MAQNVDRRRDEKPFLEPEAGWDLVKWDPVKELAALEAAEGRLPAWRQAPSGIVLNSLSNSFGPPISRTSISGSAIRLEICRFAKGCIPGTVAFSSLGLSNHELQREGRFLRYELLMFARPESVPPNLSGMLRAISLQFITGRRAAGRGEVLYHPMAESVGGALDALYLTYFIGPPWVTRGDRVGQVLLPWIVPISNKEASFVEIEGWAAFEEHLVTKDIDVYDLRRTSSI